LWGAVLFQKQYRIATTGNEMASVHTFDPGVPCVNLPAGNADALADTSRNLSELAIHNSQAWSDQSGMFSTNHLLKKRGDEFAAILVCRKVP